MESDKHKQPPFKQPDDPKSWLMYSGMAFEMFATVGIFAAAGYFLDKKFHTAPVLLIILLLSGLAAAFYRIFKQLM